MNNIFYKMAERVKAGIRASKYLDDNSRYEILDLLGHLEGELEAKDITIAALKSECLKHLLYNLKPERGALRDPVLALSRDGLRVEGLSSRASGSKDINDVVTQHVGHKIKVLQTLVEAQKAALKKLTACLREADAQKAVLLKDLDEARVKHELDNAQGDDITYCLEKDRAKLRQDLESEASEKKRLQAEVESLTKSLKEEQTNKKEIILILLEDRKKMASLYLEEKRRTEDLSNLLRGEKSKLQSLGIGLEEESKRSLAMEAELERYIIQIASQNKELQSLRHVKCELEDALKKSRQDADHFKKQLTEAHRVAMSQASVATPMHSQVFNDAINAVVTAGTSADEIRAGTGNIYAKWSSTSATSGVPTLSSTSSSSAVKPLIGQQHIKTESYTTLPGKPHNAPYDKEGTITSSRLPGSTQSLLNRPHRNPQDVVTKGASGQIAKNHGLITKKVVPPPVPPNKPAVSVYKPLGKVDVNTSAVADSRSTSVTDVAK